MPTNLIVFQYNPDEVTRQLPARTRRRERTPEQRNAGDTAARAAADRELLADGRARRGRPARERRTRSRSRPALHPDARRARAAALPAVDAAHPEQGARDGSARRCVSPAEVAARPARLGAAPRRARSGSTSVSITEEAFDQLLNPIRAKVDLGLRTLTESGARRRRRALRHARPRQPDRQGGPGRAPASSTSVARDRRSADALLRRPMFARGSRYERVPDAVYVDRDGRQRPVQAPPARSRRRAPTRQAARSRRARPARPDRLALPRRPRAVLADLRREHATLRPDELDGRLGRRLRIPLVVR